MYLLDNLRESTYVTSDIILRTRPNWILSNTIMWRQNNWITKKLSVIWSNDSSSDLQFFLNTKNHNYSTQNILLLLLQNNEVSDFYTMKIREGSYEYNYYSHGSLVLRRKKTIVI